MKIDLDLIDGWLRTITLEGELDAYTAPGVKDALTRTLDEGKSWLLVDLRKVDYIDSVGLGILIGAVKRAGEMNGDLAVVCDKPKVQRVFEVSGTAELLNVVDDLTKGVELLAVERAARGGSSPETEGVHQE